MNYFKLRPITWALLDLEGGVPDVPGVLRESVSVTGPLSVVWKNWNMQKMKKDQFIRVCMEKTAKIKKNHLTC